MSHSVFNEEKNNFVNPERFAVDNIIVIVLREVCLIFQQGKQLCVGKMWCNVYIGSCMNYPLLNLKFRAEYGALRCFGVTSLLYLAAILR